MFSKLVRWIKSLFEKPAPEPKPKPEPIRPRVEPRVPRTGIRSTDGGMRKLSRHKAGRLYDRRSGFDPDKRMVDIKDNQTRKQKKKKKGWAEDRKG